MNLEPKKNLLDSLSQSNTSLDSDFNERYRQLSTQENQNKIIYIGLIFLILYSMFYPSQNLISLVLKQYGYGDLGFNSLIITFLSASVFYLNSAYIIEKFQMDYKQQFVLSGSLFFMLTIGRRYAIFCAEINNNNFICNKNLIVGSLIIGSHFQGFALGLLWVAQRVYVDQCCQNQNKGSLTGLFFLIYQGAFALGPLLSTFFTSNYSVGRFFDFSILGMLVVLGMFFYIKEPSQQIQEINLTNPQNVSATQILKFLIKREVLMYWPLLLSPGGIQGTQFAIQPLIAMLTINSTDPNYVSKQISIQLVVLGIAQASGSSIYGQILDKLGQRVGAKIVAAFNVLYIICLIACKYYRSMFLLMVMNFFGGLSDCTNNILLSIVMSNFKYQQVEAQSSGLFISFIGRVIFICLGVYVNQVYQIQNLVILLVIVILSAFVSDYILKIKELKEKLDNQN